MTIEIEKPKFSVEHLNLYYGDFKALKDVSMDIPANKSYSIYRSFRMW